jgi:hypothetical protein
LDCIQTRMTGEEEESRSLDGFDVRGPYVPTTVADFVVT